MSDFDKFINRWFNEFAKDMHPELDLSVNREYRTVIIQNKRNGHFGMAKCRKDDEFSTKHGIAIAYAKYRGAQVPK